MRPPSATEWSSNRRTAPRVDFTNCARGDVPDGTHSTPRLRLNLDGILDPATSSSHSDDIGPFNLTSEAGTT